MEKQSVEDSFKRAFHEAEMRPSSDVWTHIELGIEKESGTTLRKRVVYYRWMAAASVLFAISLLGVGYFTVVKDRPMQNSISLASPSENSLNTQEELKQSIPDNSTKVIEGETVPSVSTDDQSVSNSIKKERTTKGLTANTVKGGDNPKNQFTGFSATTEKQSNSENVMQKENPGELLLEVRNWSPHTPLIARQSYLLHFPKTEPNQIDLLLASIEMEEKAIEKERNERKENFWTSVAMAAGSYNPINTSSSVHSNFAQSGNIQMDFAQATSFSNQVEASGYSFSSGLSLGGKIADRWTLQGGVNYLTQNSSFSSNALLVDGANNYSLAALNTVRNEMYHNTVQASSPYMVSSTLKYFNVPLQAGYLIIDKSLGWQILGGISTDFFLQNTLSAEDAGLNKVSQGSGDDSPYRTVNFSGLLGTEVSYRLGEHYRIAVNPGIRYPLQSVYKSDLGVTSAPITFDVGLKFHYIFR